MQHAFDASTRFRRRHSVAGLCRPGAFSARPGTVHWRGRRRCVLSNSVETHVPEFGLLTDRESVVIYLQTDLVCAATSCWPNGGTETGSRSSRNALAFPRTISRIRHDDSEERIASSNSISFFNEGGVYCVNPV
ncbi:MAG TPA: hypothetical protein VKB93_19145, partial [Thermoanaerobaculia bacterium]|nr:hypothetical protein [Thermoanaerobaculia bacterium]